MAMTGGGCGGGQTHNSVVQEILLQTLVDIFLFVLFDDEFNGGFKIAVRILQIHTLLLLWFTHKFFIEKNIHKPKIQITSTQTPIFEQEKNFEKKEVMMMMMMNNRK